MTPPPSPACCTYFSACCGPWNGYGSWTSMALMPFDWRNATAGLFHVPAASTPAGETTTTVPLTPALDQVLGRAEGAVGRAHVDR